MFLFLSARQEIFAFNDHSDTRVFYYPNILTFHFCSSLFLMSSKLPLENGFQKATSQNLPSIEPSSVAHFFQNSSDFVSAEFRGRKMER